MGKVAVDISVCKGCTYCIQACPKKALQMGERRNSSGYGNRCPEQKEDADCVGCAICAIVCPDSAITVYK